MKKIPTLVLAVGAAISLVPIARSDEIEFTALPQPVQTTVIRETHIANPSSVTRVVRSEDGVYAVTVRRESGEQVVYVNPEGAIVQAPASTTTTTKKTTVQEPATEEEEVVTYEQVQQNLPRYQLLEKKDKGKKEIYLDRQTGKKVKVEREKDKVKVEGDKD
jgi:ABC-type Na+ efflux pump permease subunit